MKAKSFLVVIILPLLLLLTGFQGSGTIDRKQLREMLTQLGYEIKDLSTDPGKEKYQFTLTRGGLDVPMAADISTNNGYIWLTCFLGDRAVSGEKALALLKRNAELQPTQFYISKAGNLMCGISIENRAITNAVVRQRAEKLAEDVSKSQADWQSGQR